MNYIKKEKRERITGSRNRRSFSSSNSNNRPNKKVSSLDPQLLIRKADEAEPEKFLTNSTFQDMPIQANLKANLAKKGFEFPTQIQQETVEHLLQGRDLLGIANTGTGKTGAFLIPIIEQLLIAPKSFKSLVVVPTRELAIQVEQEFKSLSAGLGLYSSCFIGGTNLSRDISQLRRTNHIIIGTPGRLLDLANRRALRLEEISTLVLDEFDRMLDMGFINDIKKIVQSMTIRKQTMLFSATIDPSQKAMINQLLHNPVQVKVNAGTSASSQIDQDIIKVPFGEDKFKMLLQLIDKQGFEKVLIFAETKRMVDKISKKLNHSGVKADLIHGNKSQNYRNTALSKFKRGNVKVLVATDVAARGIDVTDVTHVINYQLPMSFDSYIHRIGRTGRAGKTGQAFTFVD